MYIDREVGEKLVSYLGQFKVVLVTGARQVGKTTLLRHVLPEDYGYVTLDDVTELSLACRDPTAFLDGTRLPVVIDEVQQAPEL
ncbi:MAG: AAA family ATPase, partial [Olsenella sp.]